MATGSKRERDSFAASRQASRVTSKAPSPAGDNLRLEAQRTGDGNPAQGAGVLHGHDAHPGRAARGGPRQAVDHRHQRQGRHRPGRAVIPEPGVDGWVEDFFADITAG